MLLAMKKTWATPCWNPNQRKNETYFINFLGQNKTLIGGHFSTLIDIHTLDMNPTWLLYEVTWNPISPDVSYYPTGYRLTKKETGGHCTINSTIMEEAKWVLWQKARKRYIPPISRCKP